MRRELDRQRQVVQPRAQLREAPAARRRVDPEGASPGEEELDRIGPTSDATGKTRSPETPKPLPTRHDHCRPAGVPQGCYRCCGAGQEVLEVVEQEQRPPGRERVD